MLSGHYFEHLPRRPTACAAPAQMNGAALQAVLDARVIERFVRIAGRKVLPIVVDLSKLKDDEDPPPNPEHPNCAGLADSDYCRESWQLHLAELNRGPRTHWHRCDYGRRCAVVPVVLQGRCVAALKLVCPADVSAGAFRRRVELLDVLVRNLVAGEDGCATHSPPPEQASPDGPAGLSALPDGGGQQRVRHPHVLRALACIAARLGEPKLTVRAVAGALGVHPDYLAHLFARQLGQRLSRYIIAQRVKVAKTLLATTDWQIKRIARTTGHANPNWFSYVFRAETGLSPSAYRQQARCQPAASAASSASRPGDATLPAVTSSEALPTQQSSTDFLDRLCIA